jgi:hypothetical protein
LAAGRSAGQARGRGLAYSSGPVEGHVNRIKMLKRQMFGRAKHDLLRKRVLAPARLLDDRRQQRRPPHELHSFVTAGLTLLAV